MIEKYYVIEAGFIKALYLRHSAVDLAQSSDCTFPWLLHLKRFGTGLSLHDAGQSDQAENVSSE